MKLETKKFFAIAWSVMTCVFYLVAGIILTTSTAASIKEVSGALLVAGIALVINICLIGHLADLHNELIVAGKFIRHVRGNELERVMDILAGQLDIAYSHNVALQQGYLRLGVYGSPRADEDKELLGRKYARVRKYEEHDTKRRIEEMYSLFWGACHFLKNCGRQNLPKSYKECLLTQRKETA